MSVLHVSATYVPEWWWRVVNMNEVEERFVCSTSVCYLLVCARVVEECGQYEGDGGKVCLFYICLLPTRMCQSGGGVWSVRGRWRKGLSVLHLSATYSYVPEWWWSVFNMKEVEERFVCSTSICYLLVCARSGGGVWSI